MKITGFKVLCVTTIIVVVVAFISIAMGMTSGLSFLEAANENRAILTIGGVFLPITLIMMNKENNKKSEAEAGAETNAK